MSTSINHEKLHQELKTAGLPVAGVSASGRIDYSRDLTSAEKDLAETTIQAHDPTVPDAQVFFQQLRAAGISKDDIIIAIWKQISENDSSYVEKILELL